ncbi:MAG: hypothetical protein NVS1B10_02700 [Candidatus Saccharimonadales bacterium]
MHPEESYQTENSPSSQSATEHTLLTITRHRIGIVGIYISAVVVIIVLAIIAFAVAPNILGEDHKTIVLQIGGIALAVTALILAVFCLISSKIYWGNSWTLTSEGLTQVAQLSLFKRQTTQLSLANLEDVTVEQNGMLARMFNYGVLKVETAGEHSNFIFPFCPNPNFYGQSIHEAREHFEQNQRGQLPTPPVNSSLPQQ